MTLQMFGRDRFLLIGILFGVLELSGIFCAASTAPKSEQGQGKAKAISAEEYQARLKSLEQILEDCRQGKSPEHCQSDRVGPDVRLALPSGSRQIRFGWLRNLLDRAARDAGDKDAPGKSVEPAKSPQHTSSQDHTSKDGAGKAPNAKTDKQDAPATSEPSDEDSDVASVPTPQIPTPTLAQQMDQARERLQGEEQLDARLSAKPTGSSGAPAVPSPDSSAQRRSLAGILAAKEYQPAVAKQSILGRVLERVSNWVNRMLGKLGQAGFKSKWIGYTAEIGFVVLVCVCLVWFLIRLERQGRFGLALIRPGPAADSASARDWQLWLKDARAAAAQGAWRDAIHLLYWASVSRLESSGQWPADRARTPREYLALLSSDSRERPELAELTRTLERTWYAGRPADEAAFRSAEEVAAKLGISPGAR